MSFNFKGIGNKSSQINVKAITDTCEIVVI